VKQHTTGGTAVSNDNVQNADNEMPPLAIEIEGAGVGNQPQAREVTPHTGAKPGSIIIPVTSDATEKPSAGIKGM
jgi:hypothetical protein